MPLSDSGSYALVFFVTFLLVAALTLIVSKLFDKTPTVPSASAAPPFPDAYPVIPPAPTDPTGPRCFNLCTHPATGELAPCPTTALTPCDPSVPTTCDACAKKQPTSNLQCVPASAWPTVAADQAKLLNAHSHYCLPPRLECLKLPDSDPLVPCATDDDCVQCVDALSDGKGFTCQVMAGGSTVDLEGRSVVVPQSGRYCSPVRKACDPRYGTATWTERGWTCRCKYPELFGGPACNTLIACDAQNVTPWSQKQQTLLLNMVGKDGSMVGSPWSWETGVDPSKCVGAGGEQVECVPGLQPTVACQCDGLRKGTHDTYTYVPGKPLQCQRDPCFGLEGIGKTWLWEGAPPRIPNLPETTCACSGLGSHAWTKSNTPDAESEGFSFRGYCQDYTIPGTSIVIAGGSGGGCEKVAITNHDSQATFLVPGKSTGNESVCVKDPCMGQYADLAYRTNVGTSFGSMGHFDASTGKCACSAGGQEVVVADCDPLVNPVCSTCANACLGSIDDTCPLHETVTSDGTTLKDACNRKCVTTSSGTRQCLFDDSCFMLGNKIYKKRGSHECCEGLRGVEDACELASKGETCMQVKSMKYPDCRTNNEDYYSTAFICSKDKSCGPHACRQGSLFSSLDPCGGDGQSEFMDGCGITHNYPA
jgi:hypothetical protein